MSHVESVMGTVVSIRVSGPVETDLRTAVSDAVSWLHEVDDRFTTWRPGSEWLRVAAGDIALDDAHPDTRHVATTTAMLEARTHGAFRLTADPDHPPDPSAYVKGWAIQRASDILVSAGADTVMVNGGGDIALVGGTRPWRIGIQDPHHRDRVVGVIEMGQGAIATSGAYERGDHIHSRTNGTAAKEWSSVTVIGPDLGLADAYSTAAFAMGSDAPDWLAGVPGYQGYLISNDGVTQRVGFARCAQP